MTGNQQATFILIRHSTDPGHISQAIDLHRDFSAMADAGDGPHARMYRMGSMNREKYAQFMDNCG